MYIIYFNVMFIKFELLRKCKNSLTYPILPYTLPYTHLYIHFGALSFQIEDNR